MAEQKKNEADGKVAAGKKKGLPSLVLVAVGAIVGGAGVVVAVPAKVERVEVQAPPLEEIDVTHPDPIKKLVNLQSNTGKGAARVEFKFVYTVREDREGDAFRMIKANWEQANSDALKLLKNRSVKELQSELGLKTLEKDLVDELDRVLFPGKGADKVARISRVLWVDLYIQ